MTQTKSHDYTAEVWNSFKELDLEDRVPEELKMEDQNKVQVVVTKTFPKKNKATGQNGCLRRLYKYLRKEE